MAKEDKEQHFPEKYRKKLNEFDADFMDSMNSADTEEIKKKILASEGNIYEIEYERENNSEIKALKEDLKKITGPFNEAKVLETAKIKYCCYILQSRGVKI